MTLQPELGPHTLVILASKSGTTAETVEAARFLQGFDAMTLAVTATTDKPLAELTQHVICIGDTEQAHTGVFIALQAFVAGLLADQPQFPYQAVMQSLPAVPGMLVESAQLSDSAGKQTPNVTGMTGISTTSPEGQCSPPPTCSAYAC